MSSSKLRRRVGAVEEKKGEGRRNPKKGSDRKKGREKSEKIYADLFRKLANASLVP